MCPTLGPCCQKLENKKNKKLDSLTHFAVNSEELYPNFFSKLRFQYPIASTFRSMRVQVHIFFRIQQTLELNYQILCFLSFLDIGVFLRPILTKKLLLCIEKLLMKTGIGPC